MSPSCHALACGRSFHVPPVGADGQAEKGGSVDASPAEDAFPSGHFAAFGKLLVQLLVSFDVGIDSETNKDTGS